MSTSLSSFRGLLNNHIGDLIVTGTTDAAGASDSTTAIDSALARYRDNWFKDWYLHIATDQSLQIESSLSPSGTLQLYVAASAQIASAVVYEIHRYDPDHKLIAINQALRDVCPGDFYKRLYDETLYGQNDYGEPDDEFNKFTYTVPTTFDRFPQQIWLREGYTGEHTGDDAAAVLTDSGASWEVNELVGETIYNKTDGSSIAVTSNTATTVTGTLAGGDGNEWDEDDEYIIAKPNKKPTRFWDYTIPDEANIGGFEFYADINEKYLIVLAGKAGLTQFTNDASTTELTTAQAEIISLKAAANFYRLYASQLSGDDRTGTLALARQYNDDYETRVLGNRMPHLSNEMVRDW